MEYNITDLLDINQYNENVNPEEEDIVDNESQSIGNDIYFYPDENNNIVATTKKYTSIVPKVGGPTVHSLQSSFNVDSSSSMEKKEVDLVTTFFLSSMAFIGIFVLFEMSNKSIRFR